MFTISFSTQAVSDESLKKHTSSLYFNKSVNSTHHLEIPFPQMSKTAKCQNETYFLLKQTCMDSFSLTIFQKQQIDKFNTASENVIPIVYFKILQKTAKIKPTLSHYQTCLDGFT